MEPGGIELATPGSVVRRASVVRHITDCTTRPRMFAKVISRQLKLLLAGKELNMESPGQERHIDSYWKLIAETFVNLLR